MTPEEFIDTVTEANTTALSRLGSSKALYADTAGDLESNTVLTAAADAEYHAAETYTHWADTDENDLATEIWATTAEEERDHYDKVLEELGTDHTPDDPPPIHTYLRDLDDTVARAGAFIGRTVTASRSKDQFTGYFVGQAQPQTASVFRSLGNDLDTQLDRGQTLLKEVCTTDTEWNTAESAATETIQTAYEQYVETLERMGVNPKPVC